MPELYLGPSLVLSDKWLVSDVNDNPVEHTDWYPTATEYDALFHFYPGPREHKKVSSARRYAWRYEKGLIRPWTHWLKVAKKQRERALKRQRRLKRKQRK